MPYDNPTVIEPYDFEKLLTLSLSEQDGKPVLHLDIQLRPHREYAPEIAALFLPGVDPRTLYPETYPGTEAVVDTEKQEAVLPATADSDPPKSSSKKSKASDTASQDTVSADSAPAATGDAPKAEDTAPAAPKTGQGG